MNNWENRIIKYDSDGVEIGNIWSISDNLKRITEDFVSLVYDINFNMIATIETKGIIYAAALAERLSLPLIIFRKLGKLMYTKEKVSYKFTNWRQNPDGIEIEKNLINKENKLLIIDDLAEKLSTFKAVDSIIKVSNNTIVAFLCFANLSGKDELMGKKLLSIIQKPGYFT